MIQDFLSHTNCVIVWIVNLTNYLLEVDLFKWVCLFRLSTGVVLFIRTDSDLKFNSLIQWFIRSGQHLTNVEDYQAIRQQAYTESLTLSLLSHITNLDYL